MNGLSKFRFSLANKLHAWQSYRANLQYNFPFKKLKIIGVTGTDGKTTTTQMIYHILKENGFKVAYLSTISAKIGDTTIDTGLHVTTPDPWDVPKYLQQMVDAGVEYVVLEATSQGLEQNRLWGIRFETVTITNIKSDHLDYHGTWENYARAKFKIIRKMQDGGLAILNQDDEKSAVWLKEHIAALNRNLIVNWYTKSQIELIDSSFKGYVFNYSGQKFTLPLLGDYNLENALAAIQVCAKYLSLELIAKALMTFQTPTGRMEVMQKEPYVVIVDFAHTPHALKAALESVVALKDPKSRLITVFGCAGQRDKERRLMGAVSAELAEVTILTAEDPRDEDLKAVNREIFGHAIKHRGKIIAEYGDHQGWGFENQAGLRKEVSTTLANGSKPFILFNEDSVLSRRDAIACALALAKDNDIVFITGKAHEQSLAFGTKEFPWDDRVEVKKALEIQ